MNSIVSIIIPSYNRAELIEETLQSVINQTSDAWECIVVDDGSTDNSIDVIKSFVEKDSRIKLYIRDREPKGACTCRNIGIANSLGDYLIFLDTDDILEPFCIENRMASFTDDLDFAIFPALMFKYKPYDLNLWWNIDKPISELDRQFNHDAICQGTGPLWKKKSFVKMGMWNEQLSNWQDIDLFFIAYIGDYKYQKFFNLKPDLHIRLYDSSISRSDYYRIDKLISRATVIKNTFNLLVLNKKEMYFNRLAIMAFDVASGFYRSKNYLEGDLFLNWLSTNKILMFRETIQLKLIKYIYRFRISSFWPSKQLMKWINNYYFIESSIAKVKYQNI